MSLEEGLHLSLVLLCFEFVVGYLISHLLLF